MSTATDERIPRLTLGWCMKMALAHGQVSREHMAAQLGVTVSTLSRWQSDKGAPPARAFLRQWAEVTGVDPAWLETGEGGDPSPPDPGQSAGKKAGTVADLAASKRARHGGLHTRRYPLDRVAA